MLRCEFLLVREGNFTPPVRTFETVVDPQRPSPVGSLLNITIDGLVVKMSADSIVATIDHILNGCGGGHFHILEGHHHFSLVRPADTDLLSFVNDAFDRNPVRYVGRVDEDISSANILTTAEPEDRLCCGCVGFVFVIGVADLTERRPDPLAMEGRARRGPGAVGSLGRR